MQRAAIVYNPAARNAPARQRLEQAAAAYAAQGWQVEVLTTAGAGHARDLAAAEASRGTPVVFACGGDGTINEVANGLAGSDTALAVVRGGMGDVFGKEAHIPRDPARALNVLLEGEETRFDLGIANGRYFVLMAGVGFDGAVVRRVPPAQKRLLGSTAYALWAAAETVRYRPRQVEMRIGQEVISAELYWLLLGNTRSYGGVINITHDACACDGLLDAYAFQGHGLAWVFATGLRLALRRHDGSRGVYFYRAQELEVLTPGIPVQVDGEYIGETPMHFGVAPRLLKVRTPPGGVRQLLSADVPDRNSRVV